MMKQVDDVVWQWSVFSQEKQLDFNGLWIQVPGSAQTVSLLVDPPPMDDQVIKAIGDLGKPEAVVLTNKDHRRAAEQARDLYGAHIWIHERDQPLVDCAVDHAFDDGQRLFGVLEVIPVRAAKSPGECALYWREKRLLILGDALIGRQPGVLSMLPDDKFEDPAKARRGIERLADLDVDMLLLGDGVSIRKHGARAIREFIDQLR